MSNVLLIASAAALAMLVVHCWKLRAWNVTRAFFLAAVAFGFVRGNVVWLLFTNLREGVAADRPFVCPDARLAVGRAYLIEAVGWAFALYLAWTVSEFLLRRLDGKRDDGKGDSPPNSARGTVPFSSRIFMVAGLSALFMLAICYAMETTAVRVGWWRWELPTRTDLFGNVNSFAMTAWFSVVPDFLLPFLVIVCTPFRDRRWYIRWAWTLCFVPHGLIILLLGWRAWAHVATIALAFGILALMLFSRLGYVLGEVRNEKGGPLVRALPAVALAIFFAVVVGANLFGGGGLAEILTAAPLLMMCVLAWKRVPALAVAAMSVAAVVTGWVWTPMGARALWALVPVTVFGMLWLMDRLGDPAWMRLALSAVAVTVAACVVVANVSDHRRAERYAAAWEAGDRYALAGDEESAVESWSSAESLRPRDTINLYCAIPPARLSGGPASPRALRIRTRLIVSELDEVLLRDPSWPLPLHDLTRARALLDLSASTD